MTSLSTKAGTVAFHRGLESGSDDLLLYLPRTGITEYRKGAVIYQPGDTAGELFLIISGMVSVALSQANGRPVALDVYRNDDLFGESALLAGVSRVDLSVALAPTQLMRWSNVEIDNLCVHRPKLRNALLQFLVSRCDDHLKRIESFSIHGAEKILAEVLLRLAERCGRRSDGDLTTICSFTHHFLAGCIGTSREVTTTYLNRFRKRGFLTYSRRRLLFTRLYFATG